MFKLTIVTPEKRVVLNQEIDEVTVPGFKGELNILPGHAPLITTLGTGAMKWKISGSDKTQSAVVSWGYCQVSPEGVNVLANIADLFEDIDLSARTQFLADSEKTLMNETLSETEYEALMKEVARARADVDLVQSVTKQ